MFIRLILDQPQSRVPTIPDDESAFFRMTNAMLIHKYGKDYARNGVASCLE